MEFKNIQSRSFKQIGTRDYQDDSRFPDCDSPADMQRYFLVCDGVGGNADGDVASSTVCSTFGKILEDKDMSTDLSNADFSSALDNAYIALDKAAKNHSSEMATTMTFLALHGKGCTMAHIGDSRIYQIRPSEGIIYKSEDHSLVNSMVHSGLITPEQAINHPNSNVITRHMGPSSPDENRSMATVIRNTDVRNGDWFVLCTDGVVHCISDERLVEIIESDMSIDEKIHIMADESKGSNDNNTAFIVRIETDDCSDEKDGTCNESGNADEDTKRINKHPFSAEEIESTKRKKESAVSGWFNRLFR